MADGSGTDCLVEIRFFDPPAALRRYFTTFYCVECSTEAGRRVVDHLHPEWANFRFFAGDRPIARGWADPVPTSSDFCVTGPSSHAVRFEVGTTRLWGVGLLPLGWMRFVGTPASDYADAVIDGYRDPLFAAHARLGRALFDPADGPRGDCDAELVRLNAHFLAAADAAPADDGRIVSIHAALVDPEVSTVGDLAVRAGLAQRTLERVCVRAFGFTPRLLLRRQRFMRSLSQFMLDPSLKWIGALDSHYHDQAQFVRDFRRFMGMSPSAYAATPKPILSAIMRERARFAGRAVQTLDTPAGGAAR